MSLWKINGGKVLKILVIKWRDAAGYSGTYTKEEAPGLCTLISTGVYIKENKECITLGQDFWIEDGNWYRTLFSIPKVNIIEIKEVKLTKKFCEGRGDDCE